MKEYIDFLAGQAPYDALDRQDLVRLARLVEVEYVPAGTHVVGTDAAELKHLWVIRVGALELLDGDNVVDVLGPGDTFGHVSVLSGMPPALSVRTASDSLLYRIPDPRPHLRHPQRLRFTLTGNEIRRPRLTGNALVDASGRPVSAFMRPLVRCPPGTTVREAARLITEAHQSCALVETASEPGFVTDNDFRRIAAGAGAVMDADVRTVMTTPVLTVDRRTPVAEAFLMMLQACVHHLVVVDSGRPVGVVRVVDVASADVRDPLVVRSAIKKAGTVQAVAEASRAVPASILELYAAGVPALKMAGILAAVREALLVRLCDLVPYESPHGHAVDEAPHRSWLVLGSLARREPLPSSDVDTALVWADPDVPLEPPDVAVPARAWAARVLEGLVQCGLQRCPDGANADNELFSRSLTAWTVGAREWVKDPQGQGSLVLTTMAADSRPVTELALGRRVVDAMLTAGRPEDYLRLMLRFTLANRPPTGFVRDFVVEQSGEHRGRLDLKRGGLLPVTAIGRWVAVVSGDERGGTTERLRRGVGAGVLTQDESDSLIGAFELIYCLLLEQDLRALRTGAEPTSYIAPAQLDSLTRRYLREAFREITRVQTRIESDWGTRLG